jgi:hypothetical protein
MSDMSALSRVKEQALVTVPQSGEPPVTAYKSFSHPHVTAIFFAI